MLADMVHPGNKNGGWAGGRAGSKKCAPALHGLHTTKTTSFVVFPTERLSEKLLLGTRLQNVTLESLLRRGTSTRRKISRNLGPVCAQTRSFRG